jgi:hypothetical protein
MRYVIFLINFMRETTRRTECCRLQAWRDTCSTHALYVYLRRHDGGKETDEIIVLIKSAMSLRLSLGSSHV